MQFILKRVTPVVLSFIILITCFNFSVNATDDNATIIKTVEQLNAIRENTDANGKIYGNYRLGNNIIFEEGETFLPLGYKEGSNTAADFIGEFDGNGYTIKNITYKSSAESHTTLYLGLFAKNNGTIKNLIIENVGMQVTKCSYLTAGGIVGSMQSASGRGKIINCYVTGNITVENPNVSVYTRLAGVVGTISGGKVNKVVSEVDINYTTTNDETVILGGIVADSRGHMYGCGNKGNITANVDTHFYAGGIAGYIQGTSAYIQNCFNSGNLEAESNESLCLGGIAGAISNALNTDGTLITKTQLLYNCNTGTITPNAKFSGGSFTSDKVSIASGAIMGFFNGESRDNYYLKGTYSVASSKGSIAAYESTVQGMREAGLDKVTTWYLPLDMNKSPQLQAWKNISSLDINYPSLADAEYKTLSIDDSVGVKARYDDGTSEVIGSAMISESTVKLGENKVTISWRGESEEKTYIGYRAGDVDFNGCVSVNDIITTVDSITNGTDLGMNVVAADMDKNDVLTVTDVVRIRDIILNQ